jgi:alkylation response protein AidB-like acyl-CoA dehydrogenase
MDFSLNEIQLMLADSIDKFIANEYAFEVRQKSASSDPGYSKAVWETFAELGWTAVPFSEDLGGIGGGAVDVMLVMERFGRGLVVEPYLANVVLAGNALQHVGVDQQESIESIIAGELQATLAFAEPQARYDISNVETSAVKDGDNWVLNGDKTFVLNASDADLIIVPARTAGASIDASGISLFGVAGNAVGMVVRSYETVDGQRAADLALRDVRIPDSAVIGEIGDGHASLQTAVQAATLAVCAEAVGIMTVLTEKTIEYTKSRVQFGVPISSFQALQHRMVEMYTACEQSRSLLMWAAMSMDDDKANAAQAIHSLKYQIGTAGKRVGEEAVQIHGGMGVSWELDVAHYFKRLTAINLMFGNADWHLDRLAEVN